jgi:hypothetical protein
VRPTKTQITMPLQFACTWHYIQVHSSIDWYILVCTSMYWYVHVRSGRSRYVMVCVCMYCYIPTCENHILVCTSTHNHRLVWDSMY